MYRLRCDHHALCLNEMTPSACEANAGKPLASTKALLDAVDDVEIRHNGLASLIYHEKLMSALALLNQWSESEHDRNANTKIMRGRLMWRIGEHDSARQEWLWVLLKSVNPLQLEEVKWLRRQTPDTDPNMF